LSNEQNAGQNISQQNDSFQGCISSSTCEQLEQIINAFMKKLRAD